MLDDFKKDQEEKEADKSQDSQAEHAPQMLGSSDANEVKSSAESMDTTTEKSVFSSKSLKNQHGSYPTWMSKRKIQQMKSRKRSWKARLTSRRRKSTCEMIRFRFLPHKLNI
jgi:hypothetical protein